MNLIPLCKDYRIYVLIIFRSSRIIHLKSRENKFAMTKFIKKNHQCAIDEQVIWQPISKWPLFGVLLFSASSLWFGNHGERWFPLLDGANKYR